MIMYFLSNLLTDNLKYHKEEILETKWIDLNAIKEMKQEEFRSYPVIEKIIENIESRNLYSLDIFNKLSNI